MQQFILSTYKLRVVLPLTREVVAKVLLSDPIQSFETFALGALYQQVIVNTAYRTLSDDDQRTAYDAWRRFGRSGSGQQVHAYVRFGTRADVLNHFEVYPA